MLLLLEGCTSLFLTPVVEPVVKNLNRQSDLTLVCDGAPSFLLMIDSLVADDPGNSRLLINATQAYSGYATVLPECGRPERAATLSEKARQYGLALLAQKRGFQEGLAMALPDYAKYLQDFSRSEVEKVFWGGYGWATWISFQKGSPAAVADLARVEQLMLRVIELDETFYNGAAHLFLGIYYGSRPPMLGGRPEESRAHFERALAISNRRFLPVQVAYAEYYAKTAFDRDLYAELLKEVLAFDVQQAPELTLSNMVAKRRAKRLLAEINEYF